MHDSGNTLYYDSKGEIRFSLRTQTNEKDFYRNLHEAATTDSWLSHFAKFCKGCITLDVCLEVTCRVVADEEGRVGVRG